MSTRTPAGTAAQLRVRRLLAAAELEPPGLPPASVLVVRSLAAPGRVAPRPGEVRPPPEWERAVRAALAERWRGAARPLRAPVPAAADAVWFADTAEMIAAFARDARAGSVARWWWQALLKGLPGGPVAAMTALWTREARHVPAALEHLAAAGDAARIVAALPPAYATRILAAVAFAFEAPALLAAPAAPPAAGDATTRRASGPAPQGEARRDSPRPPSPAADAGEETPAAAEAPWAPFLGRETVPPGMAPEHAALLGASLMLHRAPLVARSTAFVAGFARWRAEALARAAAGAESALAETGPNARRAAESIERHNRTATVGDPGGDVAHERRASPDRHPPNAVVPDPAGTSGGRDALDLPRSPAVAVEGDETRAAAPVERSIAEDAAGGREEMDAAGWDVDAHRPSVEEARAESGACGVFYLVNVLRSMGFFRALDEHFGVAPVIGGWGWIDLVARALLGPAAAGLADDPLWRVLAELDGREPEARPGAGFASPETETLPGRWVDLFAGAPPAPEPSPPLGMAPAAPLQRFLDIVTPVLRARIHAALVAAGGDADEGLEAALLRRVGQVNATRTHVDVHMELDQATLPARLAGLDANPGWVPELARVVTFHFA